MSQINEVLCGDLACAHVVKFYLVDFRIVQVAVYNYKRGAFLSQSFEMRFRVVNGQRHENEAIHLLRAQSFNRADFGLNIIGTRQDDLIALRLQDCFNAFGDRHKQGIAEFVDDQPDGGGLLFNHAAGNGVGAVIKLAHHSENLFPCAGANMIVVAIQDVGDGANAYASFFGNIANGYGFTAHKYLNPTLNSQITD